MTSTSTGTGTGTEAPGAPPPPALWPDVLAAYAMPALTAGIAGAVTRQPELVAAALTTIAGTSALVAAVLGAVLRRRPARTPPVRTRPARPPRLLAAAGLGLAAAVLGLAAGLAAAHWLPQLPPFSDTAWPRRLPVDLPVSAAIAATVTAWRRLPAAPRPPRNLP
ncbi:hypothetical protein ACFW6V_23115 [Streptomyces sp. NPDC058734]|uniref:hypothetical protein n=1 Tax=Streptomyces sp. NPDC058734 TaxID=3346615 RepID=UPI0036CEB5EA